MAIRILFLAAQLQPFLASGIRSLLEKYEVEIIVYCENRKENELIDILPNASLRLFSYDYEPDTFFWKEIILFKPNIVFCAGWMFTMYVRWCKALKKFGAQTICAMDTQWKGTLKQKLLVFVAPFTLRKSFSHAWVPGIRQEGYARKLGFIESEILYHLYAPNTSLFSTAFEKIFENKMVHFPKRFLYVGRLESHKIRNLLLAFHSLSKAELGSWRLQFIGNGSMETDRMLQHPAINISAALPQSQLLKVAMDGGVFCLCSSEEPWGTVAQEFACAGMPLILSKQCGSSDQFLNENGFLCDGNDVDSIKESLKSIINLSDHILFEMRNRSHQLGLSTNSDLWAKELMRLA